MAEWLKNKQMKNFYHGFLGALLASAFTYGCSEFYQLEANFFLVLFLCCFFTGGVLLLKTSQNKYLLLMPLIAAAGIFFLYGRVTRISYTDQINKMYEWWMLFVRKKEEVNTTYALILVILMCLLCTVIFYFIGQNFTLRLCTVSVCLIVLVIGSFYGMELPKPVIGFYFIYLGAVVTEFQHVRFNQNRGAAYQSAGTFLFPVILLFTVFVVLLPVSKKPIEWKFVKNAAQQISSVAEELSYRFRMKGSDGLYSLKEVGFEEGGVDLGGNILDSQKTMFRVSQRGENLNSIYLKGAVKDIYTGSQWILGEQETGKNDNYNIDLYERLYYLYTSEISSISELQLLNRVDFTFLYDKLRTKSIFYPVNSRHIDFWEGREHVQYLNGNLMFYESKKRDAKYISYAIEWNMEHPTLIEYLRSDKRSGLEEQQLTRELWEDQENTLFEEGIETIPLKEDYFFQTLPDILKKRRETTAEMYLELPEELPERVYDLAEEITAGYENDYDKLNAIREYLTQFEYDVNPGNIPEGEDFVDHFLFQGQTGYCTYFASSMAVLSRCIGIPSRYAEGFVVNPETKNGAGEYLVYSSNAHAWAEIYFEGFGWIVMEATPGYENQTGDLGRWVKEDAEIEFVRRDELSPVVPQLPSVEDTSTVIEDAEKKPSIFWLLPLGIILAVGMILTTVLVYKMRKLKKRYKNFQTREKICMDVKEMLYYLSVLKYNMKPEETMTYLRSSLNELEEESGILFEPSFKVFMKARYSYLEMTMEEADIVKKTLERLKNYIGKKDRWMWLRKMQWVFLSPNERL